MLDVNWSVVLQVGSLVFFAGVTIATLKGDARNQTAQHAELKQHLNDSIESIRTSVMAVAGDSRDHAARIINLEGRVGRSEAHIDQIIRERRAP